jgi:outer membrane protein assembly factor BamA
MREVRVLVLAAACGVAFAAGGVEAAVEGEEHQTAWGRLRFGGSGELSSDAQGLSVWTQLREIAGSTWFGVLEGRVAQEKYEPYDLHRWGASVGVGRALAKDLDVQVRYRLDQYSVFDVGPGTDPTIRSVQGKNEVGALALLVEKDGRDDPYVPTEGMRIRLAGELAFRQIGGDHRFGRLEGELAWYVSPLQGWDGMARELTLVEHLALGWVDDFGHAETGVPFFERYFVGGSGTVRGHRRRWLSPRGMGDQFVGGEIQMVNHMEARLPIFKERFDRRLSAALFFDVGRAFRRFSDVGDFGYGLGMGLRYVVHLWQVHGVLRTDVGFNPAPEGDDTRAAVHVTFGTPF